MPNLDDLLAASQNWKEVGTFSDDASAIHEAFLDTPLSPPSGATWEQACRNPGNFVKSRDRDSKGNSPTYTGAKLTKYAEDGCIVVNTMVKPHWVWTGTQSEYDRMWEVD